MTNKGYNISIRMPHDREELFIIIRYTKNEDYSLTSSLRQEDATKFYTKLITRIIRKRINKRVEG